MLVIIVRKAEYINPATMTKNELIHHLLSFNINSISVNRRGQSVTFNHPSFYNRGGVNGPNNEELREALQEYLNINPHYQRSRAQKIFDNEGWQLLFTPPYNSECQPIEKIWAKVKIPSGRSGIIGKKKKKFSFNQQKKGGPGLLFILFIIFSWRAIISLLFIERFTN